MSENVPRSADDAAVAPDDTVVIRPLEPAAASEIALVAARMRATLVEVLGETRGTAMYSMDWLVDRVRFHLDPSRCTGAVFLSEDEAGDVSGHTIVRIERDPDGREDGLFSTIYVDPAHRGYGVATRLIRRGEAWMQAHGLDRAATCTGDHNVKLIALFEKHGYAIVHTTSEMVKLERSLSLA